MCDWQYLESLKVHGTQVPGTYNFKFWVRRHGGRPSVCFVLLILSDSTSVETLVLQAAMQSVQIQLKDRAKKWPWPN